MGGWTVWLSIGYWDSVLQLWANHAPRTLNYGPAGDYVPCRYIHYDYMVPLPGLNLLFSGGP